MDFRLKLLAGTLAFALSAASRRRSHQDRRGRPLHRGSSMGVSMRDGVRLAIEEINKSGGVLGRQLVAVERDDGPRTSAACRSPRS